MNFKRFHESKNLFDMSTVENGKGIAMDGLIIDYEKRCSTVTPIDVSTYSNVTLSFTATLSGTRAIYALFNDNTLVTRQSAINSGAMINVSGGNKLYICFYDATETVQKSDLSNVMVNDGSTPLPYEPYSSEVWHDIPHYIHNTSTDTLTTLPADIYPTGTTATVGLKGQTLQSSIPSPTSPVIPQGTGERTGNLLKNEQIQTVVENNGITFTRNSDGSITANGTATARAKYQYYRLGAWKYAYDTDYFLSGCPTGGSTSNYSLLIDSTATQFRDTGSGRLVNVATGSTGTYNFEIRIENGVRVDNLVFKPMLNVGQSALPYEPFGVKIPILSADTTTPVYLGEVESTRRIYKKILTGEESGFSDWKKSNTYQGSFYAKVLSNMGTPKEVICSHAEYTPTISASTYVYGKCGVDGSNPDRNLNLFIGEASWTVSDFKAYLQAQYAAGTPVCVWYVLATPTTGMVNEPLRKIGDYADEVSGITIPTIAGTNAIDVDTTLKPSEVSVNYHGWHPVTDVHERENGAWT